MTGLAVLIPFKAAEPKSRLSDVLKPSQRRKFAELMLEDLLSALQSAGLLTASFVVSSDRAALALATRSGAGTISEPSDLGFNSAVTRAMKKVRGADDFMVLPADLPALSPADLELALSFRAQGIDIVLSPSRRFDGTNLLIFSRGGRVALSYDRNSFWNHLASAARRGRSLAVCCAPGLTFDVDSPEDLRALASLRINSRSRAFATKAHPEWVS